MQATVKYDLTENAQRAQMAATGQPVARKQTVTIEIPSEDLPLYSVDQSGALNLDICKYPSLDHLLTDAQSVRDLLVTSRAAWEEEMVRLEEGRNQINPEYFVQWEMAPYDGNGRILDPARRARVDAIHAEHERVAAEKRAAEFAVQTAAIEAFLADPEARGEQYDSYVPGTKIMASKNHPLYADYMAERKRRAGADEAAKAATEAAKQAEKQTAITAWVAKHGTDSQRARQAEGLLPRDEVVKAMVAFAFDAAGVPAKAVYRHCKDEDCPCGHDEISVLGADAYNVWAPVKATLPEGYTVAFYDNRECPEKDKYGDTDDETETSHVITAYITIPFGPFRFNWEIALA